ncbi:MAG: helix-hairpin-helix domain-containing protein [Cocleimonas sp.]|nr:helix-hairpin-helix domain-containing protein [Cocleimonas sp.]
MGFNLRKTLKSLLLTAVLLPAIAFANTEFKGTETVNINRADAATLAAYLKGVGVNKAKDIVAYRNNNGKFKSIEDIKNVPGVGDETFKDNKRKMSTSRGKTVAPEGYKLGKASGKSKKTSTSKKLTTKKSTSTKKSTASSSKTSKTKTAVKKKSSTSKSASDKKSSSTKPKKKPSKSSSKKKSDKKSKAKKPKKKAKKSKAKKKKKSKKKDK